MDKFVVHIFICPNEGDPMHLVKSVRAIAGKGLEGDRYASEKGVFSKSRRSVIRHVSLISLEAIEKANHGTDDRFWFGPEETRRNIVTLGVDLNKLVGREFIIGGARFRGVELCDPCERPSKLAGKPSFNTRFAGKGGLRAEVLESGVISTGDAIHVLN